MALSIDPRAMAALEEALDAKVRPQKGAVQSNHLARVTRVDEDGTVWVHIYGGAPETPVATTLSTASEGDTVNAIISGGKVSINGNVSSPAASTSFVNRVNQATADVTKAAIAAVLGDIVQIKKAIIDQATVDELLALNATVQTLVGQTANINEVIAGRLSANQLNADFAAIDFANMHEVSVDQASVVNILGQSGLFDNLVLHEGSVTGVLKAVTILGDLIKAGTIVADRLVYQGSDPVTGEQTGLYYQMNYHGGYREASFTGSPSAMGLYEYDDDQDEYVLTADTVANPSKEYYSESDGSYTLVKPVWYELSESNTYVLTADQAPSKTYFVKDESKDLELSDAKYRSALDGSRIVAKSVTAGEIDTGSLTADSAFIDALRTVLLLAQVVQVGGMGSTHLEMRGNRFSFFAPGYYYDYAFEQDPDYVVTADKAMPGEVAYIAVDPSTNESMFYITRAVVVKDLRFGNWKWYGRYNGNLALKWIGGAV